MSRQLPLIFSVTWLPTNSLCSCLSINIFISSLLWRVCSFDTELGWQPNYYYFHSTLWRCHSIDFSIIPFLSKRQFQSCYCSLEGVFFFFFFLTAFKYLFLCLKFSVASFGYTQVWFYLYLGCLGFIKLYLEVFNGFEKPSANTVSVVTSATFFLSLTSGTPSLLKLYQCFCNYL